MDMKLVSFPSYPVIKKSKKDYPNNISNKGPNSGKFVWNDALR